MVFQVIVDLNARLDRWTNPTKPLENAHFTYGMNTDYLAKVSFRTVGQAGPGWTSEQQTRPRRPLCCHEAQPLPGSRQARRTNIC